MGVCKAMAGNAGSWGSVTGWVLEACIVPIRKRDFLDPGYISMDSSMDSSKAGVR